MVGITEAGWDRSASIWRMMSAFSSSARVMPMYARPRPSFAVRCRTPTSSGAALARSSATSPVPSGELSSTTSICSPGSFRSDSSAASTGRFSRSL